MKNRRVFAGRNSPWVESWLLSWLEVVMITSASTGLFASAGGAIRAGWCKRRGRRIKQQSSAPRTSQGRSHAPRNTLFISDGSGGCHPAATWTVKAPRQRTGQRGHRTAAAWSSRAGYTQGPRPRLRGPWALIFAVLGVLMLVSSRRESWLKKTFLVARKRPRGTWLGKSRQDPPRQVQYAACWWGRGALEERGSLASTRCPQELAPWSA